ncbi:YeeE/YedE thiosulfate transporter family protein [Anaerolinea sp.]|uniref:YeeE/YedE thiosulfate transporter family protein n=1 Tax=Anaerolinea sp. TaxID=1872519 RepID=UPI002ACD490D|nr:YeeE/YedE thiosulfate transporter family protein [Anaerolinea sp.]
MSIKSTVVILFMSLGGLGMFFLMAKMGVGQYFKHQETLSYVKFSRDKNLLSDSVTYDPQYNPWRDPWRWVGMIFLVLFLVPAVYYFFSPESKHSIPNSGWLFMGLTLLAGVVGGFAMAKSGFGTECALVSVEASAMIKKDEKRFAQMGIPAITRTLFKGLLPLQGLLASIVITGVFAVGAWVFFGVNLGFQAPVKNQLNWAGMLGGLLLGAGAVALIGCEIRSYMRLGLGYTNTLIGFIGFALGYLPYTLFYEQHKAFEEIVLVQQYTWAQLLFPNSVAAQQVFAVLWTLALIGMLVWAVRAGARNLNVRPSQVFNPSTEELQLGLKDAEEISQPRPASALGSAD